MPAESKIPNSSNTSVVDDSSFTRPLRVNPVSSKSGAEATDLEQDPRFAASVPGPSPFPFLRPANSPDEIGRLGDYRILRLLGRGGMAYVFEAEDDTLARRVALKVMRPEMKEADGWQRFMREARTMASIKHEHHVTVFQAGQEGDVAFMAMELLDGMTLHEWMQRVPKPETAEVMRIARELLNGLAYLDKRGLVHRDLKPANIWLEGRNRRVKILDLGLARSAADESQLTQTGMTMGTPGYMSPEQARGLPLDGRSDLFSLGCVLYCLCTGREPFAGSTTMAVLTALAVDKPRPVLELNPEVPPVLAELIMTMLSKKPADRPASAAEAIVQLAVSPKKPVAPRAPAATKQISPRTIKPKRSRKIEQTEASRPWLRIMSLAALGLCAVLGLVMTVLVVLKLTRSDRKVEDIVGIEPPAFQFLSELKPITSEHWPSRVPSNPDGTNPADVIRHAGKTSPHGIFLHPVPPHLGAASLTYQLDQKYRTFRADVAINDGPARSVSDCTFWVYGDGVVLFKSRSIRRPGDAQHCEVDVSNVKVLRIAVTCEGMPMGAHTIWIEPVLER